MNKAAKLLLLTFTFAPLAVSAADPDPNKAPPPDQVASANPGGEAKEDTVGDDAITIVVSGNPIKGYPVLPADDKDFKIKLADTGDVITLHWDDLVPKQGDDSEKRRVQKLYGIEISGAHKGWVGEEKLPGVRLHLASGKTFDAMPLPERNRAMSGLLAFKTSGSPVLLIHESDIKSKDPIEAFESDFFTAKEIYDRWLLEKPPASDDAAGHLDLAKKCANMELYREALDQLKMAEIIDPRTKERNNDMRVQVIKADADKQTKELYDRMLQRCLAQDWFGADEYLQKLDRNFPNSELRSRWDQKRSEIDKGKKTDLKKQIVFRAYGIALDLVQNEVFKKIKVDKKGNVVPSIPGKQVTTKNGDIFRGTLSPPDESGAFAMKVGDMNLTIAQKDILSITDIDLSEGAGEVHPSFDDMKDFVTDTRRPDGLKAMMVAQIAKALKVTEAEVRKEFDRRLDMEAHYEDGHLSRTERFVTIHDAKYGKGSWLRDGAKPLPLLPDGGQVPGQRQQPRNNGGNGGGGANAQNQNNQPPEDPELSDDPNVWWASQSTDVQTGVLRAMMAEKVFKAKLVREEVCNECAGTGVMIAAGPGGKPITWRCPKCRGVKGETAKGVLFSIVYQ